MHNRPHITVRLRQPANDNNTAGGSIDIGAALTAIRSLTTAFVQVSDKKDRAIMMGGNFSKLRHNRPDTVHRVNVSAAKVRLHRIKNKQLRTRANNGLFNTFIGKLRVHSSS